MVQRLIRARMRGQGDGGFTLIELLVVIVILGILSAVVVFAVRGVGDKGELAAASEDERTVRTAQEAHCAKFGLYGTMDQLVQRGFLSEPSTLTAVTPKSGGPCGGNPAIYGSSYSLSDGDADIKVAAAEDLWPIGDSGSGPGYHSSYFAYPLNANMYDPLIIIGSDYSLNPGLAVSWERIPVSDTTTKPTRPYPNDTWRFHLRQGVKFHDGSVFDADDVVWTWRDRAGRNAAPLTTVVNTLGYTFKGHPADSVEKISDFIVDITPRVANLRIPEQIGHPIGGIVPVGKHFDGSTKGTTGTNGTDPVIPGKPIGTGPFKHVSWTPGASAVFERNDQYWGEHAKVRSMSYEFIPLETTRTAKLQAGEVDLVIDFNPLQVNTLPAQGFRIVTAGYGRNHLMYTQKVIKDDPGGRRYDLGANPVIRRAASLAINRGDYLQTVFGGNALIGRWMAPPTILGTYANNVPAVVQDQDLARSLLAGDGWVCTGAAAPACGANEIRSKGVRQLTLKMVGPPEVPPEGYTLLRDNMRAVGIDLETVRAADNTQRQANHNSTLWDFSLLIPNQNDANPGFLPGLAFACNLSTNSSFRFAPVDGTNATGPVANDTTANGGGSFPFGKQPCHAAGAGTPANTTGPTLGQFDAVHVPALNGATTPAAAQQAAAQMMKILVGQGGAAAGETAVVIPVAGVFRIYGMSDDVNLGDPHPSQTSQRWVSLTKG